MSTRATYQFRQPPDAIGVPVVTIYHHHDGYPQGAAQLLYNAFCHRGRGMAAGFLRGNDGAELTPSHEIHGDTEYRYTMTRDDKAKAEGCWWVEVLKGYGDGWSTLGRYGLVSFINTTIEMSDGESNGYVQAFSPLLFIEERFSSKVMTKAEAEERIGYQQRLLGCWTEDGPLSLTHGNASGVRSEIKALRLALAAHEQKREGEA